MDHIIDQIYENNTLLYKFILGLNDICLFF